MKKINYNCTIKVKLSEQGKTIYRNFYHDDPITDENGFSKFQLWWFMYIFGKHMVAGSAITDDGYIHMSDNDLE